MIKGYGLKASMLEAKKRIIEVERNERTNQPLRSEKFLEQILEASAKAIGNNIAIVELEHQLNALIVEDISLI